MYVNDARNQASVSENSKPQLPAFIGQLNILIHAAAILISLSIAFALFDNTLFAWHPLFMSVGYLLFMTEGLMSAVVFRHMDGADRVRAIWAHALMQCRAVICIIIGFIVIYQNKVRNGKAHFQSTHGKFGLATLLLTLGAPLLGVISFKRLGIIQKFPERYHSSLKWLHKRIGTGTWLLALLTVELALTHPSVKKPIFTPVWQGGVAGIGVLVLLLLTKAQVKLKDDRSEAKAV